MTARLQGAAVGAKGSAKGAHNTVKGADGASKGANSKKLLFAPLQKKVYKIFFGDIIPIGKEIQMQDFFFFFQLEGRY